MDIARVCNMNWELYMFDSNWYVRESDIDCLDMVIGDWVSLYHKDALLDSRWPRL